MQKQVIATIDRFEDGYAILKHGESEILWPKIDLPDGVTEGSVLTVLLTTNEAEAKTRLDKTKNVINDLLEVAASGTAPVLEQEERKYSDIETPKREKELNEKVDKLNKKIEDLDRDIKKG